MKKNRKNLNFSWTFQQWKVIFSVLSIYVLINGVCFADEISSQAVVEDFSGKGEKSLMLKKIAELQKQLAEQKNVNLVIERDLNVQREANARLQKEFVELKNQYQKRVDELNSINNGVAGVLTRKGVESTSDREARINLMQSSLNNKVYKYVVDSLVLFDDVKKLSSDRKVEEAVVASMSLQAESLETQAGEILTITKVIGENATLKETRVLEIDKNSNIIVLAGGFNQGLREKMKFKIRLNNEKHVTLLIVAVRPFVSAAIVLEGDVKEVTVGDKASSIIENS
ncbi:hypothetical protein AAEX28_11005 [Lentisphaerota bacterium WC36G]|nr:hypothetical protein LJT99_13845 [Lentisphaerae bacterium WC36]